MKINKNTFILSMVATLVIGLLLGWLAFSGGESTAVDEHDHSTEMADGSVWTCAMHPQIRKNEPGNCPICGMTLVPVGSQYSDADPMAVSMSPIAMQLASVTTAYVGNMDPSKNVRLNGKVQEDERLIFSQSSHIPGRIERLQVNFTGEFIRKGQVIAYVYSPELVTAQQELFEAFKIKESQPGLFKSAQMKLKNWKLSDKQIDQILQSNQAREQFPITADVSGYVISKMVNLGDYIGRGQPIYEVADLSRVWVLFDIYESDLAWVKNGNKITFNVQSIPGKQFEGTISFIDPVIDPQTRVVKARVEVDNRDDQLKPEMFVSGEVHAEMATNDNSLTVPKSAVMWTGKRSVVYVKVASEQGINFVMREVTLGPAMGDNYLVESGLQPGEEIAVSGTFSIDAAAQLAGKPSMMKPEGGPTMIGHDHGSIGGSSSPASSSTTHTENSNQGLSAKGVREALKPAVDQYLQLKNALVADDLDKANQSAVSFKKSLGGVNMSLFQGEDHTMWMNHKAALDQASNSLAQAGDLQSAREHFLTISNSMVLLVKTFKPLDRVIYVQHCPMADHNEGADWLSTEKDIRNPYFGESMLTCGEVTTTIAGSN